MYSHDKNGKVISGSLSDLVNAVTTGKDIRVVIDRRAVDCGYNALIPNHLSNVHGMCKRLKK